MGALLRHGTKSKKKYLPKIAEGSLRLQSFGVTEPDAEQIQQELQRSLKRKVTVISSTDKNLYLPF